MRLFLKEHYKIIIIIVLNSVVSSVFAVDRIQEELNRVNWDQNKYLKDTVKVTVTKKGLTYFKENLSDFLLRNGITIDRSIIEKQKFETKLPFLLSKLPADYSSFQPTVDKVRELFSSFFGTKLNDPKFSIDLEKIQYRGFIRSLGVEFMPDQSFKLTGEINKVIVEVIKAKVIDLNNRPFGIGIGSPKISFHLSPSSPQKDFLKFSMIFNLMVGNQNDFIIKASAIKLIENFLIPALSLGTPLTLPGLSIVVDDPFSGARSTLKLDKKKLELELLKIIPSLSQTLYKTGLDQLTQFLPKKLENTLENTLNLSLTSMMKMDPPGVPKTEKNVEQLIWNIVPTHFSYMNGNLNIPFKSVMDDPLKDIPNLEFYSNTETLPFNSDEQSEISKHDLTLEIHQNFVNRLMHLSFERGYFEDIAIGENGDTHFSIIAPPVIKVGGPFGANTFKASLYIEQDASSFIERQFIRSPIRIHLDANVKLEKSEKNGLKIIFSSIDLNSVVVDRDRIKLLPKLVRSMTLKALAKVNASLIEKPFVLAEHVPLPESLFAVPLKLSHFKTTRANSILIFVDYNL